MPQDQRLPFPVNITDDDVPEAEETFIPFLEIPLGAPPYLLGTFADATVVITDNDSECHLAYYSHHHNYYGD